MRFVTDILEHEKHDSMAHDFCCFSPLHQFNLHPSWRVIAGGESKEVAVQRQRELRVLEAVYPRASSIPERYNFPVF
jgi:hypothetical protein